MKRSRGRSNNNNNNNNRNRGNNPNRAYESNGPGIKVRGAASTIHEKYMQLAHDATTSGDRVQAEYYYQYAEHYGRLVTEQQRQREEREAAKRAQREAKQAEYEARKAKRLAEQQADAGEGAESNAKPRRPRRKPPQENGAAQEAVPDSMAVVTPQADDASEKKPARRVRRRVSADEAPAQES